MANKEVAMLVKDKKDYIHKVQNLLEQRNTYKPIHIDPTNEQKARLINLLKRDKALGWIDENTYRCMVPSGTGSPKFYGLPNICISEAQQYMGWPRS